MSSRLPRESTCDRGSFGTLCFLGGVEPALPSHQAASKLKREAMLFIYVASAPAGHTMPGA